MMESRKKYFCEICEKGYAWMQGLRDHHKKTGHHGNEPQRPIPQQASGFQCMYCEKLFNHRSNYVRHCKRFQHFSEDYGKIECLESNCGVKVNIVRDLISHLRDVHGQEFEEGTKEFTSEADFQLWKNKMENEHKCNFVNRRGTIPNTSGSYQYYICHKSGGIQNENVKNTKKIGFMCTAYMHVKLSNTVTVKYNLTHYKHANSLEQMHIPVEVRKKIASDLISGVEPSAIVDKIRDSFTGDFERQHMVQKSDVRNIKKSFGIGKIPKHINEFDSVHSWVLKLQSEDKSSILAYKPQHETSQEYSSLKETDFLLVIQTPIQKTMLQEFGPDQVVCMDSTHGISQHKFYLITILIKDKFKEGFPVAWCISNREDYTILLHFFTSVKKQIGNLKPSCVMTDDAAQYFKAWVEVDVGPQKLLCSWHVVRAWNRNLKMITGAGEQRKMLEQEVYKILRVLMDETDQEKFNQYLPAAYEKFHANNATREFAEYFYNKYFFRATEWAACHRVGFGINTNMAVEAFHRVLKYDYMKRKANLRVDEVMECLFKYAKDKGFDQVIKQKKGKSGAYKIRKLRENHVSSKKIPFSDIRVVDGTTYVKSSSTLGEYLVAETGERHAACEIICKECNTCTHAFSCTCRCYKNRNEMCKHIHLVAQYKNQSGGSDNV